MDRRSFLVKAAAIGMAAALPFQRVTQSVPSLTARAADAARLLGFRVTDAPAGGPAVMNIWRQVNEETSVMVGWIYRDGATIWEGVAWEALR